MPKTQEIETKLGYKKNKLGWIPEDWNSKKLFEITSYVDYRGKTPTKVSEGIFLVTAKNIKNGYIDYNASSEFISKTDFSQVMSRGEVKIGDVLITTEAPLGNLAQIDKNGIALAQRVIKYRGAENIINNEYLKYFMLSYAFQKELILESTGSTVKGIKGSRLHKLPINFPELKEQKAIANCLSTWDEALVKLDHLIAAKQQLKKALMQQLFSGKKRLPGFKGKWEEFQFSDITKRVKRKNTEANNTVVTISAQRGFVLQEDFFNKRVASDTLLNYTLVHRGEFCYNKSYSNGYPMGAFKRLDDFDKAVVTTLYICFSLKKNVDSDFMIQYFEAGKMIPGLMRIAQEGGRAHGLLNISLPDFFSLPVRLPSLEEQTVIAQVLNTADNEIKLLTTQRKQLQAQKKGLMQQLLTGKKRLKV
ncbi:restriction endonuclease subunit S [Leeuwenhoekiella marinoflava]|uniref:restriction endonuclease subunit S n=1 Tax=Leeuwenhoekiella marinoflava TaxID=988 RepID=UPI0030021038